MAARKYSRQRECIKQDLVGRSDHPTAEMVYESVRKKYSNISLGTVYRNLTLLAEDGEILRLNCGEGFDRFDGNTNPHYHFLCRKCGRVTDVMIPEAGHPDFMHMEGCRGRIDGYMVYFYGICEDCLEAEQEEENPQKAVDSRISV